jgi:hypothetical protein
MHRKSFLTSELEYDPAFHGNGGILRISEYHRKSRIRPPLFVTVYWC